MSSGCRALPVILLLVACGGACGGAGAPPRGPAYTPVASAEADTRCAPEQTRAKLTREQLLVAENLPEEGGNPVTAREQAARAVLAQGECEARLVLARPIRAPRLELYLTSLGAARQQLQIARNLLEEAARYGMPPWNATAMGRLGELLAAFAQAAQDGRPTDVDPADLAGPLDAIRGDARLAFEHALRLARGAPPGSPLHDERERACAGLRKLLPGARCD